MKMAKKALGEISIKTLQNEIAFHQANLLKFNKEKNICPECLGTLKLIPTPDVPSRHECTQCGWTPSKVGAIINLCKRIIELKEMVGGE